MTVALARASHQNPIAAEPSRQLKRKSCCQVWLGSAALARQVQVHSMTMEQGVMRMRELKNGLEIKPGETVELKPGGYHLMFTELKQPLVQGQRFKATLSFANAGTVDVEYAVEAIGAGASEGGRGMSH